jgi:hypothetical protein
MEGRDGRARRGGGAALVAGVLALSPQLARPAEPRSNVRLVHVVEKATFARALDGAARDLALPGCLAVLDDFADRSGRPLRDALRGAGGSAPEYLRNVLFYDAPPEVCRRGALAVTQPGSRVVLVCGARFASQVARNSRHAEAILIHEALHSLGLGEDPPSSDFITERIRVRCRVR